MLRVATLAILVAVVSACSRTEFAYRRADWLLEYYAWKAMDASTTQLDDWQPVLQTALRQHREQQLPLVIAYLDQVERLVRDPGTSPGAACLVDGALLLYRRHAHLAVDLAVPLLAGLEAGQIRHLADYTNQRQQDAIEEYLSPDPQRRKMAREARVIERIENWTGELDQGQRQLVRDALAGIPDRSASWLEYRAQRTHDLIGLLETGAGRAALRTYLTGWWVYRDGESPESREYWQAARHETVQLLGKLSTRLTRTQRETLLSRLADIRQDLAGFAPPEAQAIGMEVVAACAVTPN